MKIGSGEGAREPAHRSPKSLPLPDAARCYVTIRGRYPNRAAVTSDDQPKTELFFFDAAPWYPMTYEVTNSQITCCFTRDVFYSG